MSNIEKKGTQAVGFWDNLNSSDFNPPTVVMGQPTSRKAITGEFNFSTGHHQPVFKNCKLIIPDKGRVMFGKGFDDAAICKSDDFYTPSSFVEKPVSADCLKCPLSQWGEDNPVKKQYFEKYRGNSGKLNQPLCKETYNCLMADESWKPFIIQFRGAQLKRVSDLLYTRLRYDFFEHPPYAVSFSMGLEKVGDSAFYSVCFDDFKLMGDNDIVIGEKIYLQNKATFRDILSKKHDDSDNEKRERVVNNPIKDDEFPV